MNNISPNLIAAFTFVSLAVSIYTLWQTLSFSKMKKTFFAGQQAVNLEDVILTLKDQLKDSLDQQDRLEQELISLKTNSSYAVSKIGLVRFNPFSGSGGNFSFSLAILDSHNTGVVITSMYGREQNRIYTKKIDNGKSETQLTQEEDQAVKFADSKLE
jgi:hypothetical protein